jgi:hypothetical protein
MNNAHFGDRPFHMRLIHRRRGPSDVRVIPVGRKNIPITGVPAEFLAAEITCSYWPSVQWPTQLSIRCRYEKSSAGKSGNEVSASHGHLSSSQPCVDCRSASPYRKATSAETANSASRAARTAVRSLADRIRRPSSKLRIAFSFRFERLPSRIADQFNSRRNSAADAESLKIPKFCRPKSLNDRPR